MKKVILILSFLLNFFMSTQAFSHCGTFTFRGILRSSKTAELRAVYVVNEQSKSQMTFEFKNSEELYRLMPLLNKASSFKGKILKRMDGTKGVVSGVEAISMRLSNPLAGPEDTGIKMLESSKCF